MSINKLATSLPGENPSGLKASLARRLRFPALWFGLALLGQAVALRLIDAGPALHYQHYRPWAVILREQPLLVAFLAVETGCVLWGLGRRLHPIRSWVMRNFRVWQLIALGLIFFVPAAAASRQIALYAQDLLLAGFIQTLGLATLILMALSLPGSALDELSRRASIAPAAPRSDQDGSSLDRYAVVAAAWVCVLGAALALWSYQAHPHITDEVAYVYQARFLAGGHLMLPAPPVPQAFDFYLAEFKGTEWYLATPPGWPAVLAIGVRAGVPWLVNPVLNGINVLLLYLLVQELYDRRSARLALLLLATSPWFIFMGMNFMTHTLTLTCFLAGAVGVARARHTGKAGWALLAGAALGYSTLIRPLDGLIGGVLVGLWALGLGGRRLRLPAVGLLVLGAVSVAALALPYNQALAGSPLTFPLNAYVDEHFGPGRNSFGFGPNKGFAWALQPFPGHSPLGGLVNAALNTFSLNVELLGWSTGSLLLAGLALIAGRRRKSDYLMLAVIAAIFVPFFFYYYSGGPDFGARYWYLMLLPLITLTVRGIHILAEKLASKPVDGLRAQGAVLAAVLALCALSLTTYIPWRAIDKYYHFWGMRPDISQMARDLHFGRSIVLVRGDSHPDYTSAAIYNPLDLNADAPIYAWDRDPEIRREVLAAYPDRPVWLVDGPSLTGSGFKVVAGPMPAATALSMPR